MTKKELYEAIVNGVEITEEMKELATEQLHLIAKKNETAARKRLEKNDAPKAKVMDALFEFGGVEGNAESALTAAEVAEHTGLSAQSVSGLARSLVKEGYIAVFEVKSQKGNRLIKAYAALKHYHSVIAE